MEEMSASAMNAEPDSLPALEELWRSRVAETYGGFVPNWTAKERGQMSNFRKICPPGAAPAVLEACLNDWALFATMAKANAGAWDLPARPTVSFLLKFVGVAVNLWLSKTKPKAQPKPKASPPPNPQQAPAAPTVKPPGEEKASLETVLAAAFGPS